MNAAKLIPWLPALAAILCGLCCIRRSLRWLSAWFCIVAVGASFLITVFVRHNVFDALGHATHHRLKLFDWIHIGPFQVDMAYLLDPLTVFMLMVVTGVGTLVAVYARGYMKNDAGYARFFAGVSLFIFAMTTLVMADNLVLLYLGWEGVGLCSYLLIGHYYDKPSAVAAAKKAFIVNRIGDLGFALGIFLVFTTYGTVSIVEVVEKAKHLYEGVAEPTGPHIWIPFLLMLGAFGKSAQIPLYVWLPDAMEGPTPVSALIHAATMVTAGVYMIVRLLAVFELSPAALPTVATIGCITAFLSATIATCQNDLKRVFAYSTISQLGYMFLGVGVASAVGGMFHLFTHAFFKALLFLTAGSVMHALAGQLDMRYISGLRHRMPITCWLMFIGCVALAGVPFVAAGFYSKDMIIAAALSKGLNEHKIGFTLLAALAIITAFLTAYYTFRLWFRVFLGPVKYEMGQEHHDDTAHYEAPSDHAADIEVEHHHEAHEMPWSMNGPLVVLALGAILTGVLCKDWAQHMIEPNAATGHEGGHGGHTEQGGHGPAIFGMSVHNFMILVSFVVSLGGIALAAYFHLLNRAAADAAAKRFAGLARVLSNKYYVDELYDAVVVRPLHAIGQLCYVIDRLIIDGLVNLFGFLPRGAGLWIRQSQHGVLQGYGLGMAFGAGVLLFVLLAI